VAHDSPVRTALDRSASSPPTVFRNRAGVCQESIFGADGAYLLGRPSIHQRVIDAVGSTLCQKSAHSPGLAHSAPCLRTRSSATQNALHCLAERPPPRVGSRRLQPLPGRLGRGGAEVSPKVSNELSNYCGANRQPRLDDLGSFGAPRILIDAHLACFTPKRSLVRTQSALVINAVVAEWVIRRPVVRRARGARRVGRASTRAALAASR
jgi:hypothetical protein